jgi:hypothetical protein
MDTYSQHWTVQVISFIARRFLDPLSFTDPTKPQKPVRSEDEVRIFSEQWIYTVKLIRWQFDDGLLAIQSFLGSILLLFKSANLAQVCLFD